MPYVTLDMCHLIISPAAALAGVSSRALCYVGYVPPQIPPSSPLMGEEGG